MSKDQGSQGLLSPFLQRERVSAATPHLNGRVLDIGCGNGVLAGFVPPEAYLGVDRSDVALSAARARHPQHSFVATLPAEAATYDTVASLAVIEHLPDPAAALRTWATYLKPGGRMILTTPHPAFEWAHEAGASIGVFSHDAAEEHEEMIDKQRMEVLIKGGDLSLDLYRRFLFGANQLFLLRKRS